MFCSFDTVRTTNVVPLKITIQRSYEGYMADTVDIRYARLEDAALRAVSNGLTKKLLHALHACNISDQS